MTIEEKLEKCKDFLEKIENYRIKSDEYGIKYVSEREFRALQDMAWHIKTDLVD